MTDYNIYDAKNVLESLKDNIYGIKKIPHYEEKANERDVDFNIVNSKLVDEIPVGIQKTLYHSERFELIYEYNKKEDLYIIINILNNNEIDILTIIKKNSNRRRH
ncbi:MAG: hypothetical protein KO202_01300 [Methanobacteriaceae archaeon]|jgi:hypothetical protein|nr:hypothetical protein [Methanobacteriaceae archaeon]